MKKVITFIAFLWSLQIIAQSPTAPHALLFQGTSGYVDIDNSLMNPGAGDFTLEAWVKDINGSAPASNQVILAKKGHGLASGGPGGNESSAYVLSVNSNGEAVFTLTNSVGTTQTLTSDSIITDGSWYHIAVVRNTTSSELQLYINGQIDQNAVLTAPGLVSNQNNVTIASEENSLAPGYGSFFDGIIDEVRFWNTAQAATTIQTNLHAKLSPSSAGWSNLQAYYQLDQGFGSVAYDYSAQSNEGTINGPIIWSSLGASGPSVGAGNNPFAYSDVNHITTYSFTNTRTFNHQYAIQGGTIQSYSADSNTVVVKWDTGVANSFLAHEMQTSNWASTNRDTLFVTPIPCGIVENDTVVCNNESVEITAFPSGLTYFWSNTKTGNPIVDTIAADSLISVTIVNASYTCSDSIQYTVNNDFTAPTTACFNDTVLYVADTVCQREPRILPVPFTSYSTYFQTLSTDATGVDTVIQLSGISDTQNQTTGNFINEFAFNDVCGNSDTCSFTISILDTIAPQAFAAGDTFYLDATGSFTLVPSSLDSASIDNCSVDSVSVSSSNFNCSDLGSNQVVFTAYDPSGTSANDTVDIEILDNLKPQALGQDITVYLNATGTVSVTPNQVDNGSSDNCSIQSSSINISNFDSSNLGANYIKLTVTDPSGNSDSTTATVTVVDTFNTTSPSPSAPHAAHLNGVDQFLTLDSISLVNNQITLECWAYIESGSNWQQLLDLGDTGSYSAMRIAVGNEGEIQVGVGDTGRFQEVEDLNTNWKQNQWHHFAASFDGSDLFFYLDGQLVATDTSTVDIRLTDGSFIAGNATGFGAGRFLNGLIDEIRVWDIALSSAQISNRMNQKITTADALWNNLMRYYQLDQGTDTVAYDYSASRRPGALKNNTTWENLSPAGLSIGPNNSPIAEFSVSHPVSTINGYTRLYNRQFAIQEGTIQTVSASADTAVVTWDLDANAAYLAHQSQHANWTLTEYDTLFVTPVQCGVVNNDTSVCAADSILIEAYPKTGGYNFTWSQAPTNTTDTASLFVLADDTITVTADNGLYSCIDTFRIEMVIDTIAPTFPCFSDTVLYLSDSACTQVPNLLGSAYGDFNDWFIANATDNFGVDTAFQTLGKSDTANYFRGVTINRVSVADVCLNRDSCDFTITILDTIAPGAVAQNDTVYLNASGQAFSSADSIDNGSSDNCGIETKLLSQTVFSCADLGLNNLTFSVADTSGNTASTGVGIYVFDTIKPQALAQNFTVYLNADGADTISLAQIDNGSTDNCSIDSSYITETIFNCSSVGTDTIHLIVIDTWGNRDTANSIITIADTLKPVPVLTADTLYLNANGNASLTVNQINNGSYDNCGISNISLGQSSFDCTDIGVNNVSVTIDDVNGNSKDTTIAITVLDSISPTPVAQNISVYLSNAGTATINAAQIENGSSDNCTIDTYTLDISAFDCTDIGNNSVILSVTDQSGNTGTASAVVQVLDTLAPQIATNNLTLYLNTAGTASITTAQVDNGTTDNCSLQQLSLSKTIFNCTDIGNNTVVFTALDVNGNVSTANVSIEVLDTLAPVVNAQNISIYLDANGLASTSVAAVDLGSTDNCNITSSSLSQTNFDCTDVGSNPTQLSFTDASGNVASTTVDITVIDSIKPQLATQNVTVFLNNNGDASVTANQIDNGTSDNCGIDLLSIDQNVFDCSHIGSNTINFTALDANGNTASKTVTVTVLDTVAPQVLVTPDTLYLDATGNAALTVASINNGSSDNCGITSLALSSTNFNCNNIGPNLTTLTATDGSGNITSQSTTVTVLDTLPPNVITQNISLSLNNSGNASITAAQIDNGSSDNCNILSRNIDLSSFDCSDLGSNTVTLTVEDVNGNIATETATVTITDAIVPNVVSQAATIFIDSSGDAVLNKSQITNSLADNCGVDSSYIVDSLFNCSDVGVQQVALYAMDGSGNVDSSIAIVTVSDTISPIANGSNHTLYIGSSGTVSLSANTVNNGSTDNCSISNFGLSQSTFSCQDLGVNNITFTANDQLGNSSSVGVQITVLDTTSPTLVLQNLTLPLDANGTASLSFNDLNIGSTDNCAIASTTLSKTTFDCTDVGSHSVTVTAQDATGNLTTQTVTIVITDATNPVIQTNSPTLYLDATGIATLTTAMVDNGSFDNCGINSMSLSQTTFNCNQTGINQVVFSATDGSGNTSSQTINVTVLDSTLPQLNTQNLTVSLNSNGQVIVNANAIDNGTSDVCGIQSINLAQTVFDCSDVGANSVLFSATDNNGNTASTTVNITVEDNMVPTVVTQNITVQLSSAGMASITASQIENGSTDNCGIASLNVSPSNFDCSNVGGNTVTLTVTDVNGNSNQGTATVTIEDNVAPTAIGQAAILFLDNNGQATLAASTVNNGSFDNCAIASESISPSLFDCNDLGNNTSQLTITDVNGNSASTIVAVSVFDTVSPVVQTQTVDLYLNQSGEATLTPAMVNNGSFDNCTIDQLTVSSTLFDCSNIGVNTVTLTAEDQSNNTGTATATVNVFDTLAPTVLVQPTTIYLDATGNATLAQSAINNGTSDNCGIQNISLSQTSFNCTHVGTQSVTLTATDVNGLSASVSTNVTVLDTVAPTVITQNFTTYIGAGGVATITPADINNGSFDNCSISTIGLDITNFSCSEVGANTVTLTVFDIHGNFNSETATVTVIDTVSPTINVQNLTVYLDAAGSASVQAINFDAGTLDNCAMDQISISSTTFNCSDVGVNTLVFSANDVNGNSSSANVQLTVIDSIRPQFETSNDTVYLDLNGSASINQTVLISNVADNCSIADTSLSQSQFNCDHLGSNLVIATVTDAAGNQSSRNFTVMVYDTTAPAITCPADIETCDPRLDLSDPTVTDNCVIADLSVISGARDGAFLAVGTQTTTFEVIDNSGNRSTCQLDITRYPEPELFLQNDTAIYVGDAISLDLKTDVATLFNWSPAMELDDPTKQSPMAAPTQDIIYTVTATTANGCESSGDVAITLLERVKTATAFSPDGDGINDLFEIKGIADYPNCRIEIFNRNGQRVFESDGYRDAWDGRFNGEPLPTASYYYVLDLGDGSESLTGIITIIR